MRLDNLLLAKSDVGWKLAMNGGCSPAKDGGR